MKKKDVTQIVFSLILVLVAYFFALDSIHIPNIGDEGVYIQIVRKTADSVQWLPLMSEEGIKNTKPPMLFWQGMLTTGMGKVWSLWNLRGPIVMTSLLVAFLIGFLVWRISGNPMNGILGGLIYLGFMSTIQQGRPFLMHAAETLFLFLPLVLVFRIKRLNLGRMLVFGIFLGLAALYKSFFLIFAGGFAMALVFAWDSRWKPKQFFKNYGIHLLGAILLGLGIFSLWIVLDPRPDLVFQDFFLSENLSKFSFSQFFKGLFSGPYTLFRIWLGNLANAGLYFIFFIALVIDLVKRRKSLSEDEKRLWLYILGFLLVYSIPAQRQENYILPTCAALAVLFALRWKYLPKWSFRASHSLMAILSGLALWFHFGIAKSLDRLIFSPVSYVVLLILLIISFVSIFSDQVGRRSFPILVLGFLLAFGLFIKPFSHSFSGEAIYKLKGQEVYFPSNFYASFEVYRFILPGADIKGYWGSYEQLINSPQFLAIALDVNQEVPDGYRAIDQIYHLKSRHSDDQIKDILFRGKFELLVNRLVLVEQIR